jgi:TolA-binding protein
MPARANTRVLLVLLAAVLPLGWTAGCTTASAGDRQTLDEVLHRLDETSRQRSTDAQRIDDLTRRIAVLESFGADTPTPAPVEAMPVAAHAAAVPPPVDRVEPPPELPVVRLAPVSEAPEGSVSVVQGTDTRVAPAVVAQEEAAPEPPAAAALEEVPYQGVGFGNDPGGGYLHFGEGGTSRTIRLQGAPATSSAPTTSAAGPGTSAGGTPSSAYGPLPRIPPMAGVAPAVPVAAPVAAAAPDPAPFEAGMEAYRAGLWQEAIGWFDRALAQGVSEAQSAQALFLKAEATFQLRDYLEAIGAFERFLARYPGNARTPEALLRIGIASERLGDDDRAAAMFHKILDDYPTSSAADAAAERLEAAGGEGR